MKISKQKLTQIIKEEICKINEIEIVHSKRGLGNSFKFKLEKIIKQLELSKSFKDIEEIVETTDQIYNELTKYKAIFPNLSSDLDKVVSVSDQVFDEVSANYDKPQQDNLIGFENIEHSVQVLINALRQLAIST